MTEHVDQAEGRGRSAKKRAAKGVEDLAKRLTELPEPVLFKLPIQESLAKEIELARRTRGHSSRKRQIKSLAGFLRRHKDECEAIGLALERQSIVQRYDALEFHHLEQIRDRLCSTKTYAEELADIQSRYPHMDVRKLSRLARSVHVSQDKKAAREIFRILRATIK